MLSTGAQAFLEMLADAGVDYLFGNPGTTELPLMDALVGQSRIQYILGLQEVPVMAMADGYAMASRHVGVVNLHISCGLGNAMGMLYNAWRESTPLIVTAGQTDRRLEFEEPILWSDMVSVARPWTKWACEVRRVQDVPSAVRRALQTALAPPRGPVFLSLPIDVQSELAELDLTPAAPLETRVRPSHAAIAQAADVLLSARNPGILAGSRLVAASAVDALVAVAEQLGAPAITESATSHGRLAFPADHPLYAQTLPLWSPEVRQRLAEFDVLLVAGLDLLRQYVYHEPSRAIPEPIRLVQFDEDSWQIGKNYPVTVGVWGDTQAGLEELSRLLAERMTADQTAAARARFDQYAAAHSATRGQLMAEADRQRAARPLTPLTLMSAVAAALPADVAVIEEAVTTTGGYLERLAALKNTDGYFGHRGWALGWGLGCALGVKLAWPERPVLALLGEGASLYGIQGLWSAARYRIPVTFVICNNGQYQILKQGARMLELPAATRGEFVGMDLSAPAVDLVSLAQSFGIAACRLTDPDEITARLAESLAGDKPQLFDVAIAPH